MTSRERHALRLAQAGTIALFSVAGWLLYAILTCTGSH